MFGSISCGTMRPQDLIPVFSGELRALTTGLLPQDAADDIALCDAADDVTDFNGDDAAGILESLFDALDAYAPAYGYFGAHPGDGADYGFWLSEGWEQDARDDGALFVGDTSEVPAGYSGEVVHVNDHGNVTLYTCTKRGKLTEVWAVV